MSWEQLPSGKEASYRVYATREQAEHWNAAAMAEGRFSVAEWLAQAADGYLRELVRTGRPRPLDWRRSHFRVLLSDTFGSPPSSWEEEVSGPVASHFGIFRGDKRGPGEPACGRMSLVHLPSRRIIGTLRHQRACKALAAELSALRIDWSEADPERVVQGSPDQEKAQALLWLFETLKKK